MLGLQWKDVQTTTTPQGQTKYTLVIRAEKAKTAKRREIPVGQRLAAVLVMRRHAPDGEEFEPEAYVFGNAAGERIASVKKAWQVCVLKAYGHTPQWVTRSRNHLAPVSQAAYREINLRFHDLRREFGSRILESGSSLVEARDLLGHANISQTSTYLESTAQSLGLAIDKLDQHQQQVAEAGRRQQHSLASGAPAPPVVEALGPERIQ